jgi:hypothetical protein
MTATTVPRPIPFWLKIVFTAFMAVMVPVYWYNYGPTNFLYFCDVSLFLTLAGVWTESALLISMCCVGILLPQALWCVDYVAVLCGFKLTGMTNYMVSDSPFFLRSLSLFHGWLPFLLVFLVLRTGYDRRALVAWTGLAWMLCLISYFWLPGPYDLPPGSMTPKNVDYVFGMNDDKPQALMPPLAYLFFWMGILAVIVYVPTHFLLRKFVPAGRGCARCPVPPTPSLVERPATGAP